MNIKDIFSKMNNILCDFGKTRNFSGENSHVFLVTPYAELCIREHYKSGPMGHVLEPLRYRGYRIWKLKGNNDRLVLFAEVHQAMNTGCLFDESSMWKYFKEKEVTKRMPIDYKKEWEKLLSEHGSFGVNIPHEAVSVPLWSLMENQIKQTINDREELMEEYVKAQIGTEIIGADKGYHTVKLEVFGESRGTIPISKNAFNTWIRNKKKGGK